jgi:hypothetical protein
MHPYFDECLGDRLIKANFSDLCLVPNVSIELCVPSTHPEYAAISFHVKTIVEKTAVRAYLRDRWINLCRKPSLIIREFVQNPSTRDALNEILHRELDLLDDEFRGKNNWNSMFVAGLLDPDVCDWLFQQMVTPMRAPDGPLTI